jgi:ATP-dependent Clp protease protease subunit
MRYSRTKSKQKNDDKNQEHISRIISLGYIDDKSANEVIETIYEINIIDSNIDPEKREPIHLIINSGGGDVYSGFGIIDAILCSQTPIRAVVLGHAMSMALLIVAVCHERVAGPNARFMYHEGHYEVGGTGVTHKNELIEYEIMEQRYDALLNEYTSISPEKIKIVKDSAKNWYFSAQEARAFNVIDLIIGEEIDIEVE